MSAPDTDPQEQRRRHWGPLLGITLAVLFGVGVIVYWLGEEVAESDVQPQAGQDAGTVNEPAQSTTPAPVIEPEGQQGAAEGAMPDVEERESPPTPNSAEELTTE